MKEWFYYEKDVAGNPRNTVCLVEKDGIYSRGWAICSVNETPNKEYGRKLARKRALKAAWSKRDHDPLKREEVFEALGTIDGKVWPYQPMFKCEFDVALIADYEVNMVQHEGFKEMSREDTWEVQLVSDKTGEPLDKLTLKKEIIEALLSFAMKAVLEAVIESDEKSLVDLKKRLKVEEEYKKTK